MIIKFDKSCIKLLAKIMIILTSFFELMTGLLGSSLWKIKPKTIKLDENTLSFWKNGWFFYDLLTG